MAPSSNENRILILDDEIGYLNLMRKVAQDVGYDVTCVSSNNDYMEQFPIVRPTVTILDIFLKKEDSASTVDFLGKNQFKGHLLFATGFDHRFLKHMTQLARDHGLPVLGSIEKAHTFESLGPLLRSVYIGSIQSNLGS